MVGIGFATRLAPRLAPDEATGGQRATQLAKRQGWQRESSAQSFSQGVSPAVAPSGLRDFARPAASFLRAVKNLVKIRGNACLRNDGVIVTVRYDMKYIR